MLLVGSEPLITLILYGSIYSGLFATCILCFLCAGSVIIQTWGKEYLGTRFAVVLDLQWISACYSVSCPKGRFSLNGGAL